VAGEGLKGYYIEQCGHLEAFPTYTIQIIPPHIIVGAHLGSAIHPRRKVEAGVLEPLPLHKPGPELHFSSCQCPHKSIYSISIQLVHVMCIRKRNEGELLLGTYEVQTLRISKR